MARQANKTSFKKGQIAWNKGKPRTWDSPTEFKKGIVSWNKGKRVPQMSGANNPNFGKHIKWTDEQKLKLKGKWLGEKNPKWVADRTKLVIDEKKHLDSQYRLWMLSVKNRDGWKCKINNRDCNGKLESHHILNWKDYPELRYDINNGITLCHAHHPRGREQEAKLSPYFQGLVAEVK